jgi:hypothetical protein
MRPKKFQPTGRGDIIRKKQTNTRLSGKRGLPVLERE